MSGCVLFLVCVLISASATPQDKADLNARDAFWSASDLVTVQPNTANATKTDASSPNPLVDKLDSKKAANRVAVSPHGKGSTPARGKTKLDPEKVSALGYGPQPQILEKQVFGIRYTMLKSDSSGSYSEVLPSGVFHSGDRIRLSVMSNQSGYLYIIEQGTSGDWKPLFPSSGAPDDSNRVEPGRLYQFPTRTDLSFQFDQRPGTEHLFLLLTRTPTSKNFAELVAKLQAPHRPEETTQSSDSATVYAKDEVDEAELRDLLRGRDLVMTTVGDAPEQPTTEKAVYIVNRASSAKSSAMIVAELALKHE